MKVWNNLPVYQGFNPKENDGSVQLSFAIMLFILNIGVSFAFFDNYQKGSTQIYPWIILPILLCFNVWLLVSFYSAKKRIQKTEKEFLDFGVSSTAKVVHTEQVSGGDSADDFYLYYQFDNRFVVEMRLLNKKQRIYFKLPIGSSIEIEYIKDNPTKSRLKQ
jgi:hypothetical protein